MTTINELKLPWRLKIPAFHGPNAVGTNPDNMVKIIVDCDGKVVNTAAQKQFCVEAANNVKQIAQRLCQIEAAYVRMCRNAGSTEGEGTILGRLYDEPVADSETEIYIGENGELRIRPVSEDLDLYPTQVPIGEDKVAVEAENGSFTGIDSPAVAGELGEPVAVEGENLGN